MVRARIDRIKPTQLELEKFLTPPTRVYSIHPYRKFFGEAVKSIWDLIVAKGGEPMFVREIARALGLRVSDVSWTLKKFRETPLHASPILGTIPYMEYREVELDADRRPVPGITFPAFGTLVEIPLYYFGSLDWQNYKLHYFREPHYAMATPEMIEMKTSILRTISSIGRVSAELTERALEIALLMIWPGMRPIISPFSSPDPDAIIPWERIAIEISIRVDNPIDSHYIRKKRERLDEMGYEDYDLLVLGIAFRRKVIQTYPSERERPPIPGTDYIDFLPLKRFPIFGPPAWFEANRPLFEAVHREVERATMEGLAEKLVRVINKWRYYT